MTEAIQQEKSEISSLVERGMEFNVGKKKFVIYEPYFGTLDRLTELFVQIEIDEEKMQEDPLVECKQAARKNIKLCSKIVAIAILNNRWKIRLFSGVLAKYLYWRLKPSMLMQLAVIINQMSNFADFINSIRLMSGTRTTAPNRIEQKGRV